MPDDITVTLAYSGGTVQLPYTAGTACDDDVVSNNFTTGASSFMPILTPQENENPLGSCRWIGERNPQRQRKFYFGQPGFCGFRLDLEEHGFRMRAGRQKQAGVPLCFQL